MQHSFDIEIATQFDIPTAIFLNNLAFWIKKNKANGKHLHDGRYWTYNSIKAFGELFPYWTKDQINHLVDKCENKYGLILKGNYNKVQYDHTIWYSLTDKACKLLNILISEKSEIEMAEIRNRNGKSTKPIPDALPALKHIKRKISNVDNFTSERQERKNGELKCLVPEWAPGHPGYDSVHGIKH